MLKYVLSGGAGTVWVVSVVMCLAVFSPLSADEPPKAAAGDAIAAQPSSNVTRTLRAHAGSVAVRANPAKGQAAATAGAAPTGGRQYAHLDEQGRLISSRPPGITAPIPSGPSAVDPVPYRSPVDPNAVVMDASHIRAVMVGRVDANGRIELDCNEDAGAVAPGHSDHAHGAAAAAAKASAKSPSTEER